jgi:hypothetical protein
MIVVNFLMGLAIVAAIVGILYGIGTFILKRSGDYDKNTDFIEIILHGVLGLALISICVLILLLIYALGEAVVTKSLNYFNIN